MLFFYSTEGDIHKALTFQLERMVKQCVIILEDNTLLAKPNAGDIIVKDVIYHSHLALYRRSKQKSFVLDDNENDFKKQIYDQVPLELALYMEQTANKIMGIYLKLSILPTYIKLESENQVIIHVIGFIPLN